MVSRKLSTHRNNKQYNVGAEFTEEIEYNGTFNEIFSSDMSEC